MFDECTTLVQLNARRRELISQGVPVAEVNAEYNRAKRVLMDTKPAFRRPPTFSGEPTESKMYTPYPMLGAEVPKNVLRITDKGIYF